jgi:hypothetical protein
MKKQRVGDLVSQEQRPSLTIVVPGFRCFVEGITMMQSS